MGSPELKGRKRRRKDAQSPMLGPRAKRQGVTIGKVLLVGRYVKKDFEGSGVFLGKIVLHEDGLYRVDYEDGDSEDLDAAEVKDHLVEDGDWDKVLMARKSKLDESIAKKNLKHAERTLSAAMKMDRSLSTDINNGQARENNVEFNNDDGDLSSDSFSHDPDEDVKTEVYVPVVPPPQLPPSSGNIGVPEEYVSYLLSVYGFLRSFSIQLFLSPFELDDFVGSLNCPLPNTLMDAIHVALMRVLKRHLEMIASDGSELASKCMRLTDWGLLDTLTWPIYLVQYLMIMRHMSGPQWKGFYVDALEKDYYSLPTGWKLMILQFLCDDVLESVELRSEIDMREEAEVGIDPENVVASASETGPRRVHPRYSKTSACNDEEVEGIITGTQGIKPSYSARYSDVKSADTSENANIVDDGNGDECRLCGMDGTLLCCDGCPSAYHSRCIGVSKVFIPEGTWYCPECAISRTGLTIARGTSLTGAEVFGVDSYGRIFLGTCNHLLVLAVSIKSDPCFKYYHQKDILKVLQALLSSAQHIMLYSDICKAILRYWDIEKDVVIPFLAKVEMDEQSAENGGGNMVVSCLENSSKDSLLSKSSVNTRTSGSCNGFLDMFFESKEDGKRAVGAGNKKSSDVCFYMGLHFKSQAYMNNYSQGDFAAAAAANLAVLMSEEKEVSESHALDKRRKMALADNLLQMKAFSSVAIRFFWPTTERKLVEVPRERCGWCLSCKAPATSKRGCLLNAAASIAIKGAMKILAGLPVIKNGEGILRAIATYIIFMEECLCGLVVGAFRSIAYRTQWRKQVEQATTHSTIKSLLLELERNIRAVALSPDWFKLVESWLIESSVTQSATISTGSTHRRGLSGRRGRKPSVVSEATSDDQTDSSIDFAWWRGGMFSKLILQRGVLPHSVVKKAARQGGCRRIPGIVYAEGSEIPKRSRQYFWRAAVEMSKNSSELALQVRRLDHYVRWSDLVRPEQTLQDGKGQEAEALAFRNAYVCDKKNMEDKIIYGVSFRSQKHLPSRVMKNIIEVEQSQDGREVYWFSETRIPLYLIKEYEEKIDKLHLPLPDKPANVLSNLQKRQLKASRKDIFSYLSLKRDNLVKCSCASCQLDVVLWNAVKCNACEGFCHERCTIGSTNHRDGKVEHMITCKSCHTKSLPQSENESPTSPLLFQGRTIQNVVTASKGFKQTSFHKPVTPIGHVNSPLEIKLGVRDSGSVSKPKIASWGLIYKKNKAGKSLEEKEKEDAEGLKFRMRHILRKSNWNRILEGPKCHLCDQPYNPRLTYIGCDTCKNWYHADSLELDESKISDLVGFKCCKCRRIRSPVCPYLDPNKRKTIEPRRLRIRETKGSNLESDSLNPAISDHLKEIKSTPPFSPPMEVVPCISGDDPLLYSLSMVEQVSEPNSESDTHWDSVTSASRTGPQKLPIRRLLNNDKNADLYTANDQGNFPEQVQDYSLSPCVEWDASGNGLEDGISFDCNDFNFEDMEFEPQTYFSFNELLAPDDARVDEANAGTIDSGDLYVDDFDNYGDLRNDFPRDLVMIDDDITGQEPGNIPAETGGNVIFCQVCSLTDPSPDLCCQICGLCLHSHCSPWEEQYPVEDQWRCGKCREWR